MVYQYGYPGMSAVAAGYHYITQVEQCASGTMTNQAVVDSAEVLI
jgi:hypothetical protein